MCTYFHVLCRADENLIVKMTIIIFLVDTSASMNQRTYLGTSLIDIAKASVETFMKIRSRDANSRWDRYMLLTFEDPPCNIKAGWKENHATFINELKHLQAGGLSSMGPSLKHCFDLLNINRMQTGIDTYGQGRCPFYLEPAVIIIITDGGKLTTTNGVQPELNLPMNTVVPGSELTKEPFRWDQRIFGLVLKTPGNVPVDNHSNAYIPSADNHPIDAMCEVTGGRSYAVYTQKMLNACLESLVQKVQSGVVINFEKIGPDPPPVVTEGKTENNMNEANGNVIKEIKEEKMDDADMVLQQQQQLQQQGGVTNWHNCRKMILVPRSAQKGYSVGHWPIPEGFWPDISSPTLPPRTAQPIVRFCCTPCEPMVIENLPFDKYELEPSPLTQFILERRQPNTCWQPLRRALARMGAPNLVPDNMDNSLSYSVITYLKKLKNQAKIEMDRLVSSVGQKIPLNDGIKVNARTKTSILQRKDFNQLLQNFGGNMQSLKQELTDYNTFTIAVPDKDIKPQYYSIPVQQMGNYQDHLKKQPTPLRELENQPARINTFGNPFKDFAMVDEADEANFGQQSTEKKKRHLSESQLSGPRKRKPGPLPKDLKIRRPITPPVGSAPSSPEPLTPPMSPASEVAEDKSTAIEEIKETASVTDEDEEEKPMVIVDFATDAINNFVTENDTEKQAPAGNISQNNKDQSKQRQSTFLWTHNTRLRYILYKEIKKPGRNYSNLFSHLNTVQGPNDVKAEFVRDIIREAGRFKKRVLIQMLEQFEKNVKHNDGKRRSQNSYSYANTAR
ncbi:hypothetical protein KUTeg_011870 [Tegillarca granosa]|uniref:VWFA domain-containing protein n=1 Tax=Tegillarca granosa TaxID=220873 RepID=A0ABQ9F342_TEGGR|nr:hypothetical protein KUTeg_011870 [Tegillarca granosa]